MALENFFNKVSALAHTGFNRGKGDILHDIEVGEQIKVLKHHPHAGAVCVEGFFRAWHCLAVEQHLPGIRLLQKVHTTQHGTFTGTGGAHQKDNFTGFHRQRHAVYHAHPGKFLHQILQF